MWKSDADEEENNIRNKIIDLRRTWCTNNNILIEQDLFPKISENLKFTFNPCLECNNSKEMKQYISQGERYDGTSFGIYYIWCQNCGKACKQAYDEY